ncbi:MAG: hypothetical protein WAK17_03405 [Candidatus Nitrosopolaris sp.]
MHHWSLKIFEGPSVLVHFQNIKPCDLIKDAPATIDDIYFYVLERMQYRTTSIGMWRRLFA